MADRRLGPDDESPRSPPRAAEEMPTERRIETLGAAADPPSDTPVRASTPLPEADLPWLMTEDLALKEGNYIFTFGFPGSGKTTFHAFLLRYLRGEGPFNTTPVMPRDVGRVDYDTQRTLNLWEQQWGEGRFPKATPFGEENIRELSFRVQPLEGVRTPLDFSFIEVSGEMLRTVMPGEARDPTLSRILRELLANQQLKLVLVLLINPEVHDNDQLFTSFLTFLDTNLNYDIRQRSSLAILISKPEAALQDFKRRRPGMAALAELRSEHVEDYVALVAPASYRVWVDWPNAKRKMIGRLHLGQIDMDGGEPILRRPDYTSIKNVFGWIYEQFTGRRLGRTPLQRLVAWFKT